MLPLSTNIKEAYTNGRDDEQKFIQNLSLFLCSFLKEHGQLIEAKVVYKYYLIAYLSIKFSYNNDAWFYSPAIE